MKSKLSVFTTLSLIYCVFNTAYAEQFALQQSEGGTLYLRIHTQAVDDAQFLLDTGSSLTLLTPDTFKKLSANEPATEAGYVNARLANGQIKKIKTYRLTAFALSDACSFEDVQVAVMPRANNILGMGLLSKAGSLNISLLPPTLTLEKCDQMHTASTAPLSTH